MFNNAKHTIKSQLFRWHLIVNLNLKSWQFYPPLVCGTIGAHVCMSETEQCGLLNCIYLFINFLLFCCVVLYNCDMDLPGSEIKIELNWYSHLFSMIVIIMILCKTINACRALQVALERGALNQWHVFNLSYFTHSWLGCYFVCILFFMLFV